MSRMPALAGVGRRSLPVAPPAGVDPLVLVGGGAAGLAVLVLVWWLARRRRRPPGERLSAALSGHDAVTVLTHPNPDPDAMASAMGVATLAAAAGATPTIRYPGEVRHHQNRAFRTVLEPEMERVDTAGELESPIVLVDHGEARGFAGAGGVEPLAVVDHHPGGARATAFTDVRAEYGACATIVTEYLESVDAPVAPDDDRDGPIVDETLATGLLFGVLSDTDYLTDGATDAEFGAASYLSSGVDSDALGRVREPRVDAETLEVKARAVEERDVRPPFAVSDVGRVDNVDAIPQAADELASLDEVTAVVVVGDDGETVHLSGRSRDDRVHVGEVIGSVADTVPMGTGGGHARMGGGQLDIEHMTGIGPGEGLTREGLHERLFAAMEGREIAERGR